MEPVFWLMRFGCTKTQRQKTGSCGLKGCFKTSLFIKRMNLINIVNPLRTVAACMCHGNNNITIRKQIAITSPLFTQ